MFAKRLWVGVFLVFFCLLACSKDRSGEEAKKVRTLTVEQVLQKGAFQLVVDASLITVGTVKDGSIPVKGSLNLKQGFLNLNADARSLFEAVIAFTSWDSGLVLRDDRVRRIFFGTDEVKNQSGVFLAKQLSPQIIEKFKQDQKLPAVTAEGTITFGGVNVPVLAQLSAEFNEKQRLVVKTLEPFTLKISDLKLTENLKKLMVVCAHQSVDDVVAVEVYLEFEPL